MLLAKAKLLLFIAVGSSLAACGSQLEHQLFGPDPQDLINGGATRIGGVQTRAHVSGNTEVWREGNVYYKPDGELELRWHKARSRGTWEVTANGIVCWNVPAWKTLDVPGVTNMRTTRSERNCHYYLDDHGKITTVQGRHVIGVNEIKKGRNL